MRTFGLEKPAHTLHHKVHALLRLDHVVRQVVQHSEEMIQNHR